MALTDAYFDEGDIHPIDVVENLANYHDWEFDRIGDDQIAMQVEGQWRTYALTLAWSPVDETLRLICTFEMETPAAREGAFYDVINRANDMCWAGSFVFWPDQKVMSYRYGLLLSGDQVASPEQVDLMIAAAVSASERFYPAFQLVAWGERSPESACQIAIDEAYGTA